MTISLTNYKPDAEIGGIESNKINGAINIFGILQKDYVLSKRTYNILGDLTIPEGINLKIEAGSILNEKVANTSQILVEGNLEAIGTLDNPIIFTDNSDPLVGQAKQFYWEGINVKSGGKLVLDHGEIRYAGTRGIDNSGSLDITNSKITNTQSSAIWLSCSSKDIRIENNEISKCGSSGIFISNVRGCNLTLQKNVTKECTGESIFVNLTSFKPEVLTGGLDLNTLEVIRIGGTLQKDLKLPKNTYVISSNVIIPSGITLTIDAGSIFKVKALSGEAIKVEGTLNANGTLKEPIIFTSFEDPQYGGEKKITYWGEFGVASKGVLRLDYTQIKYSGLGIKNTAGNTINCSGTLRMNNSTIANSNGNGIVFSTLIQPLLKNNSFVNNVNYSVKNSRASTMTIDATNNYWGSAAGPALYNKTTKTWSTDGGKISEGVSYIPFYKKQSEMPIDTPVDTEKWSLLVIKNASNEDTKIYTLETDIESEKVTIILDESEQTAVKLVMKNGSWVESPQLNSNTLRANSLSASTQQGYSYWVQWFSKKSDAVVEKKLIELIAPDVRTKITEIFGESVPTSSYQMIERGISDSINDNLYNGLINKVQSAFRPKSNIMYARAKMITDAFFVAAYMEAADKPISLVLPYVGGENEQEIFKSIIRDNNATSWVVALPLLPLITSIMSAVVVVIVGQDAIKAIANELTDLVADFRESLSKVVANEGNIGIAGDLEDIAGRYGNYECVEAKDAMAKFLDSKGLQYEVITLQYHSSDPERNYVCSRTYGYSQSISTNGFHTGIVYNGMAFCNVHPYGLTVGMWLNDFDGEGPWTITPAKYSALKVM